MFQQQHTASFQDLIPLGNLEAQLKSNSWNTRKQIYEQILYLLQQNDTPQPPHKVLLIGGNQYSVKKLIPFFEDIVDEQHPGVLIAALMCVETMIQKGMCSGREFVKLTDQGFDKFPLKINKGKQIMQKFADIIEKIELDPHFLMKKLQSSAHQKCIIFTLEVVSMLGMAQLYNKVRQIAHKHPKSAVRQVAVQICSELEEIDSETNQAHGQTLNKESISEKLTQGVVNSQKNKLIKPKNKKKIPPLSNSTEVNAFTRSELEILEKVPQFEQLKSSKDQQNQSEGLMQLFKKYFQLVREGKAAPQLPLNQLTNLSHIVRIMIESNNAIISTNGLRIMKILTQNNCSLIGRSFPLLFIFEKFRLHATHQINQLLYQLCDSLLLCNSVSTMRNVDLIQAVSQGANNKKANVKYGSFMVFLRTVAIVYKNQQLFADSFPAENMHENGGSPLQPILNKINEGDVEKIKLKIQKQLAKCLQNFSLKFSEDKKYDEKLQDIKITMSLVYGGGGSTTQSAVSSIDNLTNKTFKKSFSQVSPKILTNNNSRTVTTRDKNQFSEAQDEKKRGWAKSVRGNGLKIVNPEQKSNKILDLCRKLIPNRKEALKKLVAQSLSQFEECIEEQRFQLFYYSEVVANFMNCYSPSDQTSEIISEYLLQILLKISKAKSNSSKNLLREGLRNVIKVCFCTLVLGQANLQQILTNFKQNLGLEHVISAFTLLNESKIQSKIKKKNRKIILDWLDANVPAEHLTDGLFEIMEKIENGESLGRTTKHSLSSNDKHPEADLRLLKKITFNNIQNGDQQMLANRTQNATSKIVNSSTKTQGNCEKFLVFPANKKLIQRQVIFKQNGLNQKINVKEQVKMKIFTRQPNQISEKIINPKQSEFNCQLNVGHIPGLDGSQISQISCHQDQSIFGSGPTQRYIDNSLHQNMESNFKQDSEKEAIALFDYNTEQEDESRIRYMQYYDEYKRYKEVENENFEQEPHFGMEQRGEDDSNGGDNEGDCKIQAYRQYIRKVRQTYLPAEYMRQDSQQKEEKHWSSKIQESVKVSPKEEAVKKQADKISEPNQLASPGLQQNFQYKILNVNKLSYMIHNAANPYSHLRNQIILPFKKSEQQQYFLKQINLYITSLPQIKHPQPYNSLLLVVILLFSEIHTNRTLIAPLQELYEHLASLVSTNQFLKIIISHFHSVIEETSNQLRAFLITILTKSVARLMPFCQDSLELLRDLSQFYNVGQNVYFEMYEAEYSQICKVVQGEALYEVVERALVQEQENLSVIVESWFETKLKSKIKQYISIILHEREEEKISGAH